MLKASQSFVYRGLTKREITVIAIVMEWAFCRALHTTMRVPWGFGFMSPFQAQTALTCQAAHQAHVLVVVWLPITGTREGVRVRRRRGVCGGRGVDGGVSVLVCVCGCVGVCGCLCWCVCGCVGVCVCQSSRVTSTVVLTSCRPTRCSGFFFFRTQH